VREVIKRDTKKKYALKYINKEKCIEKGSVKNIFRERMILEECEHPFIINLQFAFQDDNWMFMVLDLAKGGDLRFHLNRYGILPEQTVRMYAAEISSALFYLHSKQIVHRDLKPENLLLDEGGHVCITDFNVAVMLTEKVPSSRSGTTTYMAPEMFTKQPYKYSVDWWALGCVLYECSYSMHPFTSEKKSNLEFFIREKDPMIPPPFSDIKQHKYPYRDSEARNSFIRGLLEKNVVDRLGSKGFTNDVRPHPWFEGMDWGKVLRREYSPDFIPNPDQQNYDFGAALEELLYESSPLTKRPVRKRHLKKNKKPMLAYLWNDDSTEKKKKEEELDYIDEYFESYVKPPAVDPNALILPREMPAPAPRTSSIKPNELMSSFPPKSGLVNVPLMTEIDSSQKDSSNGSNETLIHKKLNMEVESIVSSASSLHEEEQYAFRGGLLSHKNSLDKILRDAYEEPLPEITELIRSRSKKGSLINRRPTPGPEPKLQQRQSDAQFNQKESPKPLEIFERKLNDLEMDFPTNDIPSQF